MDEELDELFGDATVIGQEVAWLEIDHDFRRITIPASKQILGVTSDEDVNIVHFRCPRYCGEVDLGDFNFRINYMNAGMEGNVYIVEDKEVTEDQITFSWVVGRDVCTYAGSVQFIVCAKLFNGDGLVIKEYNTIIHTLPVLQGLETE